MSVVYLNGEFLPAENATVSVFDRGFLLGDGIYEVIPAFSGCLFRLDEHLDRLQNSLDAIQLLNPMSRDEWEVMFNQLISENMHPQLSLYLQITRGVAVRDHAFPKEAKPSVFAMANPIQVLADSYYENGVAAITTEDNRWQRCNIKAISLLPNVLLRQQAVEQGAAEVILIRDGNVTEGAASNVFVVIDGKIITPPKGQYILPGITRDLVLELAVANKFDCGEQMITHEMLLKADEIWVTSSTKEVLPVTKLDGKQVGIGKPGPVWQVMVNIYREYKTHLLEQPRC